MTDDETPPMPPAPPAPPSPPEAPIGAIVDPNAQSSGLLKQPTPEDLAKFAPPPPIVAPPQVPQDAPRMGDTTAAFGVVTGTIVQPPPVMPEPPPPVEVRPKAFHELSERTQAELKTGWAAKNKGKEFPADWVEPILEPTGAKHDPNAPLPEPEHDAVVEIDKKPVKVSQRTLDELEAGRKRLAERKAETDRVRALQAQQNAEKLVSAQTPQASDMDYTEGR